MARKPRKFSTENVNYYLHPGLHIIPTELDKGILEDIDALILEASFDPYENIDLTDLLNYRQYSKVLDSFLEKEEIPSIFIVDLPSSKYLENLGAIGFQMTLVYENLLKILPPFLSFISPIASIPLFISTMTTLNFSTLSSFFKGRSESFDLISSYLGLVLAYHPYGIRGATTSEKIDEFIAPLVYKEKGKIPSIFIDYGAIHGDIEPYLKHKALRESVIRLHGLWNYFPFNREYLDKVCEFSFETQRQSEIERRISYEQIIHTLGSDKKETIRRGSITKVKFHT